jgi:hypothetical protein
MAAQDATKVIDDGVEVINTASLVSCSGTVSGQVQTLGGKLDVFGDFVPPNEIPERKTFEVKEEDLRMESGKHRRKTWGGRRGRRRPKAARPAGEPTLKRPLAISGMAHAPGVEGTSMVGPGEI